MLRLFALLALSIASIPVTHLANAAPYKDPSGRFDVSIPDGWQTQRVQDAKSAALLAAHPKTTEAPYDAVCLMMYIDSPNSRSKTQAELNTIIDTILTPDFWKKSLESSGKTNTTVEAAGTREQGGRKIAFVVFSGTTVEKGETFNGKGKMEMQFVPGALHTVMCATEAAVYDLASADFETVFMSYEPHVEVVVASSEPAPPSVLTMFAETSYTGAARVLSQDTPSLAAAGMVTTSASLIVDGAEPWQVCDGVNYAGQCRTIVIAENGSPGRRFVVASARRLPAQSGMAGFVATELRRALSHDAIQRAFRRH